MAPVGSTAGSSVAIDWEWWGASVPYAEAWERQRAHREAVIAGDARPLLALLEHRAVITTGRRSAPGTADAAVLAAAGIDYHETERGGLATWHGPGQLVGYAVVPLAPLKLTIKRFVCALEDGIIRWLEGQGIEAGRAAGRPGIWVGGEKICALGLNVSRGVTMHGFALNLDLPSGAFEHIVPCGIADAGITSVRALTGHRITPEAAAPSVSAAVLQAVVARTLDACATSG